MDQAADPPALRRPLPSGVAFRRPGCPQDKHPKPAQERPGSSIVRTGSFDRTETRMGTPEEYAGQFVAGVGEGLVAPAGERWRSRGLEKDRQRSDTYDRARKAEDQRQQENDKAREAFNATIRVARRAHSLWREEETRTSLMDIDPYATPEEVQFDTEEASIQHARFEYGRYTAALSELEEALDALVDWYTLLTFAEHPSRNDLVTLVGELERVRDERYPR